MDQFKESIEAIVAPIHGPERDKNNLRRELWAHFCAVVEEERGRGIEDRVAGNNALARLGTPDEIRTVFVDEMHPVARTLYRLDARSKEGDRRHAILIASITFVASVLLCSIIVIGVSWQDPEFTSGRLLMLGILGSSLCLWESAWSFLSLLRKSRWEHAARIIFRDKQSPATFIRMILVYLGAGVLLGAVAFYGGYLFLVSRLGEFHAETISYLYVAPFLFAFIALALGTILPLAVFRNEQHAQYIPGWPYQSE